MIKKIIISLFLSFFFILPASAAEKINLMEMSNKLNEAYTQSGDTYVFSFNNKLFEIEKDNPIILVNKQKKILYTEKLNGMILPKYGENNLEMNYEKFLELTEYDYDEKGIIVKKSDEYEKPEAEEIKELDISYIKDRLIDIGYEMIEENEFVYKINDTVIQTVYVEEGLRICEKKDDYEEVRELLRKMLTEKINSNLVSYELQENLDQSTEE